MCRFTRLLPLLLLAASVTTDADAITVDAPIDAVTVYPGRVAAIERVVRARVPAGRHELRVAGLAAAVEPDSVRLEIESGDGLRLGATEVVREPVGEPPREREAELRERLAGLEAERAAAEDRKATAATRLTFVRGLAQLPQREGAPEQLAGDGAAQRWPELWDTIARGAADARSAMRSAERKIERLSAEIDAVNRKIDALGGARKEAVRVTAALEADAAVDAALRLTYRVRGPSWEPTYEARLDTAAGRLTLVRTARVRQATGADWDDVRLALATTQPVRGSLPELPPWWIDFRPQQDARATAGAADLGAKESLAAAPRAEQEAATTGAEFAATYRIPGRVSVPGSNDVRTLRIGETTLDAEVGVRVTPQQDHRAWLTAAATWAGEGALPPGELARFRDGAFVGATRLEGWPPGEARTLAFGVDPRFEVDFRRLKDEAGESGLISRQTTRVRHYRLRLVNRHDRALPASVRFRVPVARAEDITVEPWFPAPPDTGDVDDRRGVHEWTLDLGAGAEHTLELGYRVAFPSDREVPGF